WKRRRTARCAWCQRRTGTRFSWPWTARGTKPGRSPTRKRPISTCSACWPPRRSATAGCRPPVPPRAPPTTPPHPPFPPPPPPTPAHPVFPRGGGAGPALWWTWGGARGGSAYGAFAGGADAPPPPQAAPPALRHTWPKSRSGRDNVCHDACRHGSAMSPLTGTQYEIAAGEYLAAVTELGAGLRELRHRGQPLITGYQADELPPGGAGQLLLPGPNRIDGGRYRVAGADYQLDLSEPAAGNAIHGLTRWSAWSVASHAPHEVVLRLALLGRPGYPFRLDLEAEYN